jgi:hypothetical protein
MFRPCSAIIRELPDLSNNYRQTQLVQQRGKINTNGVRNIKVTTQHQHTYQLHKITHKTTTPHKEESAGIRNE